MLKKGLPFHSGALNFKKLIKALDQTGKGQVDINEFVGLIDQASATSADTSPFHRIVASLHPGQFKDDPNAGKPDNGPQRLVRSEDKMDANAVVEFLGQLIETEKRVGDPVDEIKAIFEKI